MNDGVVGVGSAGVANLPAAVALDNLVVGLGLSVPGAVAVLRDARLVVAAEWQVAVHPIVLGEEGQVRCDHLCLDLTNSEPWLRADPVP